MSKMLKIFSLSALLAIVVTSCVPKITPTDQGIPWALAEHRSETISDLRYHFALDIPQSRTEVITGKSRIRLDWNDRSAQPLVIDFLLPQHRVHTVLVNGMETDWKPVNDHIVIPATALNPGMNSIDLTFDAGDEAFNRREDFLYALFVPDRAHFSLPLFDQPNLKGQVTWEVTVPEQWKVIANGPEATSNTQNGRTHFTFLETQPMPSYLFAIAAGVFERETAEINGRTFNMYHRETDTDKVARNRDEIFRLHASTLDWLEDYTQIDYPFQKFDFVLIPSFQYGGMEHPGGILYRQAGIFLDETATQNQMLGRASLIAHETAHMWFGDLVTMNWFDDVWTKEVFANFMAAKIVNPSFPEVDHELRFLTAHHPTAYSVDRTDGANPIRQPLENLRFAGTLYGAIIYQKAPIVMRHLENRVGADLFRDGMREYLSTYAYGNATWPDLIALLDERSEQDLAAWSQVWIEEAGRPSISISWEDGDVVIRQQDPAKRARVWPQTLEMRIGSIDANELITIELGSEPQRLQGFSNAKFILPNGSGIEYGEFILDTQSQVYLIANVDALDTALLRGATWVTLWEQLLEGRLAPSVFLQTALDSLAIEQNELIVSRILAYTSTIYWNYLSSSERRSWSSEVENLLWSQVMSERSRSGRSSFYSAYRNLTITEEGVSRLQRLWTGDDQVAELPLSELDQISLASGLAIKGIANAEEVLSQQQERIENPDRLARFKFLRASLSVDPAVRANFFESLKFESNRDREAWVVAGLYNIHHPLRAGESIELIYPALNMIEEIQETGDIFFPGRWLDSTLQGHNSLAAAETVKRFLDSRPNLSTRLRLKILQSADEVFRSARLLHGWDVD
ncbi:MAG: peptidase M1 [SAR86 cluster bacterium]|uniref:Aminopeptidase N n=1 Tax=SAR86 cluster bacterium TaxID=2030880 RepID=A0A2A4X804_9GAMM|nr:MAG: peptidase M1 [SAR86 cluster bacterium]